MAHDGTVAGHRHATSPTFLAELAEAVRNITLFYDGLVVPGALLLLGSGTWLIIEFYGGWAFLEVPWLAGMVLLFAFEFVEGNSPRGNDGSKAAEILGFRVL